MKTNVSLALTAWISLASANKKTPWFVDNIFQVEESSQGFNENHLLKPGIKPKRQSVVNYGTFSIGGIEVSLADEDLKALDVFAKDAILLVDGTQAALPAPTTFQSAGNSGVIISRDSEGKLISATYYDEASGKVFEVDEFDKASYAEFSSDDIDKARVADYKVDSINVPGTSRSRYLRSASHNLGDSQRSLQADRSDCTLYGFDVIEVAIAVDSSLCSAKGGSNNVASYAQDIIALSNLHYQDDGLCKKLAISTLDINCNTKRDPFKKMLNNAASVCDDLVPDFRTWVSGKKYFSSCDVALLFHGKDFSATDATETTVGCAYNGGVCSDYKVGVAEMTFWPDNNAAAVLVSHETGHILNAAHDTGIMTGENCAACLQFSDSSKKAINAKIDSSDGSCVEWEAPPTESPTGAPSASSAPSAFEEEAQCKDDDLPCALDTECCSDSCDNGGKPSKRTYKCLPSYGSDTTTATEPQPNTTCNDKDGDCRVDTDCCNGGCSSGKPGTRYCLT